LNDPGRSLQCGRKALEHAPNNEVVRRRLAYCLVDLGQLADAEEHLRWLLRRKYDPAVERRLRQVTRMRTRSQRAAAPSSRTDTEQTTGRLPVRR
jgi:thioredoxin-like negative regulator of GroEL